MIKYFKNFPLLGYAKLAFGVFFIIMGLVENQTYIAIIGCILSIFSFINKGACPGDSCIASKRYYK